MCSLMLHKRLHLKNALARFQHYLRWAKPECACLISHGCNRIKASQLSYDLSVFAAAPRVSVCVFVSLTFHRATFSKCGIFTTNLRQHCESGGNFRAQSLHSICYLIRVHSFSLCCAFVSFCSYFQINATYKSQFFHLLLAVSEKSRFLCSSCSISYYFYRFFFLPWVCALCLHLSYSNRKLKRKAET